MSLLATITDQTQAGTNKQVTTRFNTITVNQAPSGTDFSVSVTQDVEYTFNVGDIVFTDAEGDALAFFKVTKQPTLGKLTISGVQVVAEQSYPIAQFSTMKYVPPTGIWGAQPSSIKIQLQDDGNHPNLWSDDVVIDVYISQAVGSNAEPEVMDYAINVNYGQIKILHKSYFTQDFYDAQDNSFSHIEITSLPDAGDGALYLNDVLIGAGDLPQTVTEAQLLDGLLEYRDNSANADAKTIDILFTVYDDVV